MHQVNSYGIQIPDDGNVPYMDPNDIITLINALQNMTVYQAQLVIPSLSKYSIDCLTKNFKNALKNPPLPTPNSHKKAFQFTPEEDFWLITFLRYKGEQTYTKERFLTDTMEFVGHNHTFEEISQRLIYLNELTAKEKDTDIDQIAKNVLDEEMFYLSTEQTEEMRKNDIESRDLMQLRCNYAPDCKLNPHSEINMIISQSHVDLPILTTFDTLSAMKANDLAVLRSINVAFPIRREAIVLGRNQAYDQVDIDLSTSGPSSCPHISRKQAILSFLEDCCFYIENIGNRAFRVNGVPIYPDQMCRIPAYAILDFSGVLFLFVPNTKLIDELSRFLGDK
ncbi:hypothetical protein TVAG_366930 [Trichomonas vaginalis G3]|uniref:FHA domain-containing protein n=1 Tax=Trichomonas vaginalis (strain ATCC PRA-98 / G3) TaxID=412133 RepID=A2FZ79_TRIV3|nr:G-quadruplex RNA binding [Trichomonas vaginalis G3]EAX89789.1 hypothetical protein TVAG_366930 [Trichomonas vaginalis G3]KAI5538760.1 G-quadruplex RNA binding [Trichomonas vaginalis G3]|eukprot:XP_001302719.1 hypothetical protein [Trichomonas vaginalis G3]